MASYAYNGTMYEQNPRFSPSGWTLMSLPFIESLLHSRNAIVEVRWHKRAYRWVTVVRGPYYVLVARSILLPKRRSRIVRTLRYYIVDNYRRPRRPKVGK